ncbi:MAG: hypothetical protein JRG86_20550 [Deltaproteobacteria bacterium]|jgi:hypothetical protein|nr:hypothetical protein [Deltaproteobacteria bacterium]
MRFLRLVVLPLLVLALMGADCEFYASSNTRPPSTQSSNDSGVDRREGLNVGIVAGDTSGQVAAVAALGGERQIVQSALAASAIETTTDEPTNVGGSDLVTRTASLTALPAATGLPLEEARETPSNPVPEPAAGAVFAAGLVLLAEQQRRRHLRRLRISPLDVTADGSPAQGLER